MQNIEKTFTRDDLLKIKMRSIIYRFILENPGLHFRELGRRLNIPKSTLSYHLQYLEAQELLIVKKGDRYTRYFISKDISEREKKILNIIRMETARNVLLYMWGMVIASEIEIAEELDKQDRKSVV
jgi:predicted transcriptional regulator